MAKFSFGSDPEFILRDKAGNYRSAIGVIPGTKEDKVDMGNECYAFYDNVLCEVNIKPGFTKTEVINNFRDCFQKLAKLVGNLTVVPQASQTYPKKECDHPDAFIFGCEEEFSIYNLNKMGNFERLSVVVVDSDDTFRSGGGHVHIGHESCLPFGSGNPPLIVQMLDVYLGVPSLLLDHDPTSAARRKLYGTAGTHRIQFEYGLEYRSLSNFWLASPKLVNIVYDVVDFVLDSYLIGDKDIPISPEEVQRIINKNDKSLAAKKMSVLQKRIPTNLYKEMKALMKPQNFDFYKEWNIKT